MKTRFEIDSNEYNGPFNLNLTVNSGQTSQPAWKNKNDTYCELVNVGDEHCLISITQDKSHMEKPLEVEVESHEKVDEDSAYQVMMDIFGLNDDLNDLYEFLGEDPELEPTVEFCRGLRLFKAHDPFECIISSISSANCSIVRWNRSIKDIKKKWGNEYVFNSGKFYTFPRPDILKKVAEHDLEEMQRCEEELPPDHVFVKNLKSCGVGYRAKYIINSANLIENKIDLRNLSLKDYEEAFNIIIQLPGVGPKVADCILLYGFGVGRAFPVDVWISRIVSNMYFNGEDIKPSKARLFGMEKFKEYAGYVQLYMFHYARKSGLLDSLRK